MIWQLLYSIVHTLRISTVSIMCIKFIGGLSNGSFTLLDFVYIYSTCTVQRIVYV